MKKIRNLTLLALAAATVSACAQGNNTFETKLQSVAIFRSGFGFYTRVGTVKLIDGWATTNFLPKAIRGSVWVYPMSPGDRVDQVIATRDNTISFKGPQDIPVKLKDRVGSNLTISLRNGQTFQGNLNRLLDNMLLVQNGAAYNAVPYDQIAKISLVGFPLKIKLKTANPNGEAKIGIAYLQDGISWDPSYVLNVGPSGNELTLRASMQNPGENLAATKVLFVSGNPYISNRGMDDPFAEADAGVPAPGSPDADAKSIPKKEAKSFGEGGGLSARDDADAMIQAAPGSATPEAAGELYYYSKTGIELGAGDTGMITIFDRKVDVSPMFDWNADGDEVDYLLDLKNPIDQPLTSAPVFVIEDGKPLGQDVVKYTGAGGTAELRLSKGVAVHVDKSESETKRSGPVNIGKATFIPVTLTGKLTISNLKSSDMEIHVAKTVIGKVDSVSNGGVVKDTQVLNGEPNPTNKLDWKLKIKAGETVTITYTYMTYMTASRAGSPPIPATPSEVPVGD